MSNDWQLNETRAVLESAGSKLKLAFGTVPAVMRPDVG
jgi:hypothetical protein